MCNGQTVLSHTDNVGPSGSGKTSLLNVLSGRVRTGTVEGKVLYNGVPLNKAMKGKVFGYVLQQDALQENLTVREVCSIVFYAVPYLKL